MILRPYEAERYPFGKSASRGRCLRSPAVQQDDEFDPLAVSRFYITDSLAQSGRPFGATVLGEQNGSEKI